MLCTELSNITRGHHACADAPDAALRLQESESKSLAIALKNYTRCLLAGDRHDLHVVFRLCELWFEHSKDAAVNDSVADAFAAAPSHKFVPLVYQIASRASCEDGAFQRTLTALLVRLAAEHPYHTLPQLLALRNGNLDPKGQPTAPNAALNSLFKLDIDMDKVTAANRLLAAAAGSSPVLKTQIETLSALVGIYIELAAMKMDSKTFPGGKSVPVPGALRRKAQPLLNDAPLLSEPLAIDPTGTYSDVVMYAGFGDTMTSAGGINVPKILKVR